MQQQILFSPQWHDDPHREFSLHALLLIEGDRDDLRESAACDEKMIEQLLEAASTTGRCRVFVTKIRAKNGRQASLLSWASSLKVFPDDVLFFYYSGHGQRDGDRTVAWPMMVLGREEEPIASRFLQETLSALHPRLLVFITDCCNDYRLLDFLPEATKTVCANEQIQTTHKPSQILKKTSQTFTRNIRDLFYNDHGIAIITASEKEKAAGATDVGGIMTRSLYKALHKYNKKHPLTWKQLFKKVQKTSRRFGQIPYFVKKDLEAPACTTFPEEDVASFLPVPYTHSSQT